jgi:hypothetical protein
LAVGAGVGLQDGLEDSSSGDGEDEDYDDEVMDAVGIITIEDVLEELIQTVRPPAPSQPPAHWSPHHCRHCHRPHLPHHHCRHAQHLIATGIGMPPFNKLKGG